jgi:acetoin utilization protein AcuB
MYVKDHMTPNPYTITKDVVISKAVEIMRKNHFHRLPIVDEQGRLTGLVTGGLVEEQSGANSTSLSIYELNYLLSKTKVADIMIKGKDVKTISQDVFVEVAAQTMLDNEISCLPVVDEDMAVLGLITTDQISNLLG